MYLDNNSLSTLIPIINTEAQLYLAENSADISRYITNFSEPSANVRVPVWANALAYSSVSAGTIPGYASDTSASYATITATRWASVHALDALTELSVPNLGVMLGKKLAQGAQLTRNTNIFNLFSSFTQTVGDTSTALSVGLINSAINTLKKNGASGPFYVITTPQGTSQIKKEFQDSTTAKYSTSLVLRDQAQIDGSVPMVAGAGLVETILLSSTIIGASSQVSAVIDAAALGINKVEDFSVEINPLPTGKQYAVSGNLMEGYSVLYDGWGVGVIHTATV